MMNENDCILSVRGLDIRFNLRGRVLHAIRGIDLDLYRGEVLAVVGESGSGKSVFTKSFMGLLDTMAPSPAAPSTTTLPPAQSRCACPA